MRAPSTARASPRRPRSGGLRRAPVYAAAGSSLEPVGSDDLRSGVCGALPALERASSEPSEVSPERSARLSTSLVTEPTDGRSPRSPPFSFLSRSRLDAASRRSFSFFACRVRVRVSVRTRTRARAGLGARVRVRARVGWPAPPSPRSCPRWPPPARPPRTRRWLCPGPLLRTWLGLRVRASRSRSTRRTQTLSLTLSLSLTLTLTLSLTLTLTLRTSRGQGRHRAASMTARQPAGRSCEGGRASASAPRAPQTFP